MRVLRIVQKDVCWRTRTLAWSSADRRVPFYYCSKWNHRTIKRFSLGFKKPGGKQQWSGIAISDMCKTYQQMARCLSKVGSIHQHWRSAFFYSSYSSFRNTMSFGSVPSRSLMIPILPLASLKKSWEVSIRMDLGFLLDVRSVKDISASPELIWLCMDNFGSIESPGLAQPLHVSAAFLILALHWEPCGLLLSWHQILPQLKFCPPDRQDFFGVSPS